MPGDVPDRFLPRFFYNHENIHEMSKVLYWYDKITRERIWGQNDDFTLLVKIGHTWLESLVFGIEATNINSISGNIIVTRMK